MMELMDDSWHNVDSDNECENKKLILKKNLSWTNCHSVHCNSLAKLNSLKTSRSNPHVLDAVTSNVRSLTSSKIKLATSQLIPNCFHSQTNLSDDTSSYRLPPLAKGAPALTLTAATTHQTLATPTAIQFSVQQNSNFQFSYQAILRHCKVNSQLTRKELIFFLI